MRRDVAALLDEIHESRREVHGDVWPQDWRDWLRSWADTGLPLRAQAAELVRLYPQVGEVSHSTVRNLHDRIRRAA